MGLALMKDTAAFIVFFAAVVIVGIIAYLVEGNSGATHDSQKNGTDQ
jgi:hypothetical protein